MKLFKLDEKLARHITHFDSNFYMNPVMQLEKKSKIALMTLQSSGIIGYHQAHVPQLLIVLEGEDFVRSEHESNVFIQKGMAVLWEKDEWHETRTDTGLVALVIESEEIPEVNVLLNSWLESE